MTYLNLPFTDVEHPQPMRPLIDTSAGFGRIPLVKWDEPKTIRFRLPPQDDSIYSSGVHPVLPPVKHSDIDEIIIVTLRELSYEDAKAEIEMYIQKAGDRKVYISELAEELCIDIDLIIDVLSKIEVPS